MKRKASAKKLHAFTYRFSELVLGLEFAALLSLARQHGLQVDKSSDNDVNLFRLMEL